MKTPQSIFNGSVPNQQPLKGDSASKGSFSSTVGMELGASINPVDSNEVVCFVGVIVLLVVMMMVVSLFMQRLVSFLRILLEMVCGKTPTGSNCDAINMEECWQIRCLSEKRHVEVQFSLVANRDGLNEMLNDCWK